MTDIGLDYAWARPDLDLAWSLGYRFVSRYLSWLPNGKVIDATELEALLARGFEVALNWEFDAQDQLGGASAGNGHALEAVRQAKALGYPAGCTIYFSADFDATAAQQQVVNAYMAAAGKVVHAAGYRAGIYGGYYVVKRAFDAGVTDDGWQTYAWSGGQWDPRAAIRQDQNGISVGGADCDHNTRVGRTYLMGGHSTVEDDMEQGERVTGFRARGNTVGDVLADLGNFRDWLYAPPGEDGHNPPPDGSRAQALFSASQTGGVDVTALAAALAGNTDFVKAIAKAVNDDLHARTAE